MMHSNSWITLAPIFGLEIGEGGGAGEGDLALDLCLGSDAKSKHRNRHFDHDV